MRIYIVLAYIFDSGSGSLVDLVTQDEDVAVSRVLLTDPEQGLGREIQVWEDGVHIETRLYFYDTATWDIRPGDPLMDL